MSPKWLIVLAVVGVLVIVGSLLGPDKDQDACNNAAGNGKFSPVHEDGKVWCENAFNGKRFFLRDE